MKGLYLGASSSVAVLLAALVVPAVAIPAYTGLTDASVTTNNAQTTTTYKAVADGNIAKVADSYISNEALVFGYAWVDFDTGNIVAATIHPQAGKDSTQNPNNWHPHTATLAPDAACSGVGTLDLRVMTLASPKAGLAISGNTVTVTMNSGATSVTPDNFDFAASFELVQGTGSALCVVVLDTAT